MKVSNRYRWRELDDWYNADYRYRYTVYTGCCFCNDPWTPQVYWNSYYNPYYNHYSYGTVKTVAYNKPRTFNLNTYTPTANNTKQSSNKYRSSTNNNSYTESRNNNSNSGNLLRNIFNGNNNSGGNKNNSNTSSGSSGNNNSGSSGSSAPVRRF